MNRTEKTLIKSLELIVEMAEDSKLNDDFWAQASDEIHYVASRLGISSTQTVLLAVGLQCGPRNIDFNDYARFFDVRKIHTLNYNDDLKALIRARYMKYHDAKEQDSFDIPASVVRAIKNNEVPEPPVRTGLDCFGLFDILNELFNDLDHDAILPCDLSAELKTLFKDNRQVAFCREINALETTGEADWLMLVLLCHFLVNEDNDRVYFRQLEDLFSRGADFTAAKAALRTETHPLMRDGWISFVCEDGQVNTSQICLTTKAKQILLSEFQLKKGDALPVLLTLPEKITEKKMFYTRQNDAQICELSSFLSPERYTQIHARMKESGFRQGFACLFYGAPGTGKTETVQQLARQTGRGIFSVNVSDIRSKWVGESEKNIKDVFDHYRSMVSRMDCAPILLFNEADAVLGIRQEGAERAVDKMENSIQNIILQEMETLDGILVATTNLTQNLDPAFERRFLYKIRFEKPDAEVRKKIWARMIPSLTEQECALLAAKYDFSGGQVENIARKYAIHGILAGESSDKMSVLYTYCDAETLDDRKTHRIGF